MNKKGIISMHPVMLFIMALVLGMIIMYLIAKGIIPLGLKIC